MPHGRRLSFMGKGFSKCSNIPGERSVASLKEQTLKLIGDRDVLQGIHIQTCIHICTLMYIPEFCHVGLSGLLAVCNL